MEPSRPKVLLVNDDRSATRHLLNHLRSLGCLCLLTHSYVEACALFHQDKFNLVLGRFAPPEKACHDLVTLSEGTQASFFYFYVVEHSCWWIPRVYFGQECWGEAALHPRQFVCVLEKLIREIANASSTVKGISAKTTRCNMQARITAPALQPLRVQHWQNVIADQAVSSDGPKAG